MRLLLYLIYATMLSVAVARKGLRSAAGATSATPEPFPTRVLIVGATGGTGRQLVMQALERGHEVTALVRERTLASSHRAIACACQDSPATRWGSAT